MKATMLLVHPMKALLLLTCAISADSLSTVTTGCTGSAPCKKILALHGGGMTSPGFRDVQGMVDLVSGAGAGYEFIFPTAPYCIGATPSAPTGGNCGQTARNWIMDPPGGKSAVTTDPNIMGNRTTSAKRGTDPECENVCLTVNRELTVKFS